VGPAAHLRAIGIAVVHDAPEVGANLQDHVDYTTSLRASADGLFGLSPAMIVRTLRAIGPWRHEGRGLLTTNVAEAGGFVKSDPALDRPDLQLHFCVGMVDDHGRKSRFGTGYSLHVCALRP
ncbi:GMC family oxidoreductase N-terminal domain-containing protein, partial [Escherichia coli]|nr:GMC family oxidoreductase N-terminal domain-containing protein [Escherichia coli]